MVKNVFSPLKFKMMASIILKLSFQAWQRQQKEDCFFEHVITQLLIYDIKYSKIACFQGYYTIMPVYMPKKCNYLASHDQ